MTSRGTVARWSDEHGWGVIESPDTPDGCWAHYSAVETREPGGDRTLTAGDAVTFTWEHAAQDGFTARATAVWRGDREDQPSGVSAELTLTFDDDPADAVRRAAEQRAAALAAGDADALTALLHPAFVWTTHRGDRLDRATYVAGNCGGDLTWHAQELHDVEVCLDGVGLGVTAVLTAIVADRVTRAGQEPATYRMPVTQVWVAVTGGWVCLAGHAGPLLDPLP